MTSKPAIPVQTEPVLPGTAAAAQRTTGAAPIPASRATRAIPPKAAINPLQAEQAQNLREVIAHKAVRAQRKAEPLLVAEKCCKLKAVVTVREMTANSIVSLMILSWLRKTIQSQYRVTLN